MFEAAPTHRKHKIQKALEMPGTSLTAVGNISLNMNHISNKKPLWPLRQHQWKLKN